MFSCRDVAAAALVLAAAGSALAQAAAPSAGYAGIGRPATAKELQAWDIDVRPDFKGLPKGSGSVAKGMEVWEGKCASCHGIFGESNEVFSPLVGGTTKDDVRTGRVARLTDPGFPGRTTLMKVSSVSTLWDYINRAMPWNQPKSLTVEEVYAVTAYLLNLGGVLPDDYVMSDRNIAEVQQRLPNRNGVTTAHAMWPGAGLGRAARPDAAGVACMRDCATEPKVASILPDHARGAHGNLAEQNRLVGAQHGVDTRPAGAAAPVAAAAAAGPAPQLALAQKHACTACHGADNRIVGPGFKEIAGKYAGRSDAEAYLLGKIRAGGQGVWGQIPMPAQTLPEGDARALARWLAAGAAKP
ncbi:c-type cytochrome [Piscinibacter sakaiensis]|uniref:Sulfite dehydrogenase, cytochrome subunit SoxD n=1 Tax=Piscinibacter sakaiensis TaxID=1547922 RepID=A0A0K8P965_PISS1|nr:c-type cytochrome [Piscinibacter sakaiensis]GAP38730.1 sulfite dehydrogenase, cytochrome subunit SoxD [Piscinibacter sakaiensis]